MASLATGSVNFPKQIYENPPDLVDDLARTMLEFDVKPEIELFDLSMLYNARDLAERGLIRKPLHVQFVMGIPTGVTSSRSTNGHSLSEDTCVRVSKTTSNSTAIASRKAMRSWWSDCVTYAINMGAMRP